MKDLKPILKPDFERKQELEPMAAKLRELIEQSGHIIGFTGAGVSAESGIPTYRGAGGMWSKWDPEKFASIDYFHHDPTYYWTFFKEARHDIMVNAKPNPGHYAFAELEARGNLSALITQNIDNLHITAGSKNVLELHGNTTRFYCTRCRSEYDIHQVWEMVRTQMPVRCDDCSDVVRPDVVLYGEMLPQETVMQAEREADSCDLMIMVGSSLSVYPAANLPYRARERGAKLVIINVDPTPLDGMADLVFHSPAAHILAQAVWAEKS